MIDRPLYMNRIRPFIGKNIIKVLIGARRSGKSTLLELVRRQLLDAGVPENAMLHLNFESSATADITNATELTAYVRSYFSENTNEGESNENSNRNAKNNAPADVDHNTTSISTNAHKIALFLDEIQEVDHWEKAVRSFMVDYDADIYLTGSNAHMLSSDLATYITGRYVSIDVYPFSFAEFLEAYRQSAGSISEREAFQRYVRQGGFPFQTDLAFDEAASMQYLNDLFATILFKDVVRHAGVRDPDALERIIRYAIGEEGHLITVANIAQYMKNEHRKVAADTIANYLDAAARAFLLYRAPRQDAVGMRELKINEKYYVVDQGLRQAIGLNNANAIDQVLEGIVFMELKRRGYEVRVGKVGDQEIDFIAQRDGATEYYQVTYLMASPQTAEREFGAFAALRDNYPKTVLSLDEFPQSRDGIQGVNIIKWLLAEIRQPTPEDALH